MPCTSASQAATFLLPPTTFVRTSATHSTTAHIPPCHKVRLTKESQNSLIKGEPPPWRSWGAAAICTAAPAAMPRGGQGSQVAEPVFSRAPARSTAVPSLPLGLAGVLLAGTTPQQLVTQPLSRSTAVLQNPHQQFGTSSAGKQDPSPSSWDTCLYVLTAKR